MKKQLHTHTKQRGFTLIESLLTLFILSVGMLGIAGMQLQGLKSGGLAMQQMIVVIKSQEIIERMRSAVITNTSGNVDVLAAANLALYSSTTAASSGCLVNECSAAAMVADDLFHWQTDLAALLPGTPTTSVTVAGRDVTVSIAWMDKGATYTYQVVSQL